MGHGKKGEKKKKDGPLRVRVPRRRRRRRLLHRPACRLRPIPRPRIPYLGAYERRASGFIVSIPLSWSSSSTEFIFKLRSVDHVHVVRRPSTARLETRARHRARRCARRARVLSQRWQTRIQGHLCFSVRHPGHAHDARSPLDRYSKEFKYRPAASPVITERLRDGRIRLRGAHPT